LANHTENFSETSFYECSHSKGKVQIPQFKKKLDKNFKTSPV